MFQGKTPMENMMMLACETRHIFCGQMQNNGIVSSRSR